LKELDKRLHAYRADIADEKLGGQVVAGRFVASVPMEVAAPVVSVYREPSFSSMQVTQGLFGEKILAYEVKDDWIWGQLQSDGYVGYIPGNSVTKTPTTATHRVSELNTFMYPKPDIKSQPAINLPLNAQIEVIESDGKFSRLSNGLFVYSPHIKPHQEFERDYVATAEKFLGVPYYWGGKTARGLDCSGLVQTAFQASGLEAPRDADMQEQKLGQNLMINDLDSLRRGDLIFWDGHVGIMLDERMLLHANGFHMMTVKEPLADAIARIEPSGGSITSMKRL
jgi:cell wall-associated NlpC family hydrolase